MDAVTPATSPHRKPRHTVDAARPYAFLFEQERSESGETVPIATVFLTTGATRPLDSSPKSVSLAGTPWYSDLSIATKIAEREKKPLLILQMMGRLDDAFC